MKEIEAASMSNATNHRGWRILVDGELYATARDLCMAHWMAQELEMRNPGGRVISIEEPVSVDARLICS